MTDDPNGQDPNIFQDPATPGTQTPPDPNAPPAGGAAPTPPQEQDPLDDPRVKLAIATAQNDALKLALQSGSAQRQDPVTTTQPPLPNNPLDLLPAEQRKQMEELAVTDPVRYSSTYADLAARLERARLEREAAPMIATTARTIVDLFKNKMARLDAKMAPQIEPLFDEALKGLDLRPLVNMADDQRENELMLRWRAAKAQVLERQIASAPAPRPEPRLNADGTQLGAAPGPKKGKVEDDAFLGGMAEGYKFTPEQMAELEEIM